MLTMRYSGMICDYLWRYLYISVCLLLYILFVPSVTVHSLPSPTAVSRSSPKTQPEVVTPDMGHRDLDRFNLGRWKEGRDDPDDGPRVTQVSPCVAVVDGHLYNLEPLQKLNGEPRFKFEEDGWIYTYNPCVAYNIPTLPTPDSQDDPHNTDNNPNIDVYHNLEQDVHDQYDGCYHVAFCRYESSARPGKRQRFYTLGLQRTAWIALSAYDPVTQKTVAPLANIPDSKLYSHYLSHLDAVDESSSSSSDDVDVVPKHAQAQDDEDKASEIEHEEELEKLGREQESFREEESERKNVGRSDDVPNKSHPTDRKVRHLKIRHIGHLKTRKARYLLDNDNKLNVNSEANDSIIVKAISVSDGTAAGVDLLNSPVTPSATVSLPSANPAIASTAGISVENANILITASGLSNEISSKNTPTSTVDPNEKFLNKVRPEKTAETGGAVVGKKNSEENSEILQLSKSKSLEYSSNEDVSTNDYTLHPVIYLSGLRYGSRRRLYGAVVILICDRERKNPHDAKFIRINSTSASVRPYFELHHLCCCPDGCARTWMGVDGRRVNIQSDYSRFEYDQVLHLRQEVIHINESRYAESLELLEVKGRPLPRYLWLILVINGSILLMAVIVAATCCRQGGRSSRLASSGQYTYLPAIHRGMSRLTLAGATCATDSRNVSTIRLASADYREYTSSLLHSSRLPVLDCCVISNDQITLGQRLGGGMFADTYVAEWKKRHVAVKRLIIGGHKGKSAATTSAMSSIANIDQSNDWIVDEVSYLSQQRHSTLVSVLGVCLDSKQPHIVMEFVPGGETLREYCREPTSSFQRCVKLSVQVGEGMAFLHSAKPPVLHRDLRGANVLVDRTRGKIKLCDYGLTHIIQRQRADCTRGPTCYCQPNTCAYPSTIRWTAPEILACPRLEEGSSGAAGVFTPACDVYSFGMLLWEVGAMGDPFEEISNEAQVIEIVQAGERPDVDTLRGVVPHYKKIMVQCWDQSPQNRPIFQDLIGRLKQMVSVVGRSSQKRERCNSYDSTATNYLRSALNLAT